MPYKSSHEDQGRDALDVFPARTQNNALEAALILLMLAATVAMIYLGSVVFGIQRS